MPKKYTDVTGLLGNDSGLGSKLSVRVILPLDQGFPAEPQLQPESNSEEYFNPNRGMVLVLSTDETLVARLQRAVAARRLPVCWFTAMTALLANPPVSDVACVVLDLNLEATDGWQQFEQLKASRSQWPIIILAKQFDVGLAVRAMRGGAADVLGMPCDAADFLTALDRCLAKSLKYGTQLGWTEKSASAALPLNDRERAIVGLVLAGLLNKQIAAELHLALVTVKLYRGSAMRKLGARSAAELARIALERELFRAVDSAAPGWQETEPRWDAPAAR